MPDNLEVEQKYVVDDEAALLSSLANQGLRLVDMEHQTDTYFRHPCRDFRQTDEAFRLRQNEQRTRLTYKGPRLASEVKIRPEIEVDVATEDIERWQSMLRQLGFEALAQVRKARRVYSNADASGMSPQVVVDQVQQLGLFAEIEVVVTGPERVSTAQQQIETLADRLGLSRVQRRSYLAQLLEKLGLE